mmetsp:Transcript_6041/g.7482  ORF Transcript_6041/g.7482 Transcript_6041/m.7482 type:complete len:233 (-) Transcript_6041:727-1425(-)
MSCSSSPSSKFTLQRLVPGSTHFTTPGYHTVSNTFDKLTVCSTCTPAKAHSTGSPGVCKHFVHVLSFEPDNCFVEALSCSMRWRFAVSQRCPSSNRTMFIEVFVVPLARDPRRTLDGPSLLPTARPTRRTMPGPSSVITRDHGVKSGGGGDVSYFFALIVCCFLPRRWWFLLPSFPFVKPRVFVVVVVFSLLLTSSFDACCLSLISCWTLHARTVEKPLLLHSYVRFCLQPF